MTMTIEHYRELLRNIHDEASSALASGEADQLTKALGNIQAMARYELDVVATADRIRPGSPPKA